MSNSGRDFGLSVQIGQEVYSSERETAPHEIFGGTDPGCPKERSAENRPIQQEVQNIFEALAILQQMRVEFTSVVDAVLRPLPTSKTDSNNEKDGPQGAAAPLLRELQKIRHAIQVEVEALYVLKERTEL